MRKTVLLFAAVICTATSFAQRTYSAPELRRLEDLGRIWGMVHYFHPAMGSGKIVTDSLIIRNAGSLAANPSAENFRAVVNNMLGQLGDPSTRLSGTPAIENFRILSPTSSSAQAWTLKGGWKFIALPTAAAANPATQNVSGILPATWDSAAGVVLDLRNNSKNYMADYDFVYDYLPLLRNKIMGAAAVPALQERTVYHNGLVPQHNGSNNIYFSGYRTATKGTDATPAAQNTAMLGKVPYNKPVIVILNKTNTYLHQQLWPMQRAGKIKVVYEGDAAAIGSGSTVDIAVADGQTVAVRVSDYLIGGAAPPRPDKFLSRIDAATPEALMGLITDVVTNKKVIVTTSAQPLSLEYHLPKPGAYAADTTASVGQRLFALYNFWNAIQYFFPYKNLLDSNWNGQLAKFLPRFINANTALEYNLAIRALVHEIHDSHGFINNLNNTTPLRAAYGAWPPISLTYIGDKLYVTDVATDGEYKPAVQVWDEVVRIDGQSVTEAANNWRPFFAYSNEADFKRDVIRWLPNGHKSTSFDMVVRRNGKDTTVQLQRSGRVNPKNLLVDFNDDYPTVKRMDSIGYINMGALQQRQVDSVMNSFMNTKAIIYDIRNYPQGTAWTIAPRLAKAEKKAVRFERPVVTSDHIFAGEGAEDAFFFFTVRPDTTRPRYKGKVIMLCNESTQSQAEYSIMMFQGATDVTVVGSTTAGADGNVTNVLLPGGYTASFSGLSILYPDGGQTQRTGIRVDIPIKPTLDGLKAGKDEVMERAMQFIKEGK